MVSIVTICYNNLQGLRKTAESVLSQTCRNFEWIIIDGGSSDGSGEYIRNELSEHAAFWCSERDGGIYEAQNKGIAKATGEYVICMNAGDTFADSMTLEKVAATAHTADILYGDWVYDAGETERLIKSPSKVSVADLIYGNCICHQSAFVRTSLMQKSPFDLSYRIFADWAKFRELLLDGATTEYLPFTVCRFEAGVGISEQDTPARQMEIDRMKASFPSSELEKIDRARNQYDVAIVIADEKHGSRAKKRGIRLAERLKAEGFRVAVHIGIEDLNPVFGLLECSRRMIVVMPENTEKIMPLFGFCRCKHVGIGIDIGDAVMPDRVIWSAARSLARRRTEFLPFASLVLTATVYGAKEVERGYGGIALVFDEKSGLVPAKLTTWLKQPMEL